MSMNTWPPSERPRERLLRRGPSVLSDAELLAIFIHTGCAGRSAVDIARDALSRYGGLLGLLDAGQQSFCATQGLGPAKFALLRAALELGRRYLDARMRRGEALTRPEDTRRFLQAQFKGRAQEMFGAVFLDNRHRVIEYATLFMGTIDGASVHPREVVKRALDLNAAALIVAHNHPSGVAEPSVADQALTRRLSESLGLVDIRLLDHVVIGDCEYVSFADRGWL